MTAFSLRPPGPLHSSCAVRKTDDLHRMKDGHARRMISCLLHLNCRHSFCAVRKTACHRKTGGPRRMKGDRMMTSFPLRHGCGCFHSSCAARRTACLRMKIGFVRKMKFFFLRPRLCLRSFCVGHNRRCGLRSFRGPMNVLLFRRSLRGSDNRRAGHNCYGCHGNNSCGCCRTACTLRQLMMRQAPPSFSA